MTSRRRHRGVYDEHAVPMFLLFLSLRFYLLFLFRFYFFSYPTSLIFQIFRSSGFRIPFRAFFSFLSLNSQFSIFIHKFL
ncbi:hypothetical protein BDZ94DRAFT_1243794 [Collybia nuda]|uniref:Uncharacterized protein n=1 Tax=Collybia nuda TaxID=64659 RepID=A0A9P5YHR0_9AGAR|nr:hypothetical protein BDZ94DRAFT_1243794 [Collybia nuda]